jgi:hypothetical protein
VKNEPIISLAQYFIRYRAGLLSDKDRSKVIFAAFFYPRDEWFCRCRTVAQNGLGFFDNGDGWNSFGVLFCELFLIA